MVIERSAISPQDGLSPVKQSQSSLAHNLDARAVIALDEAREMPPGDERTEATHKAIVLRNAAGSFRWRRLYLIIVRPAGSFGQRDACPR
jgi:hypothetical protein